MNEYLLVFNLMDITKEVYKKIFAKEGYEIISEDDKGILIGKDSLELDAEQVKLIWNTTGRYVSENDGFLVVDITEGVLYLRDACQKNRNMRFNSYLHYLLRSAVIREKNLKHSKSRDEYLEYVTAFKIKVQKQNNKS